MTFFIIRQRLKIFCSASVKATIEPVLVVGGRVVYRVRAGMIIDQQRPSVADFDAVIDINFSSEHEALLFAYAFASRCPANADYWTAESYAYDVADRLESARDKLLSMSA